MKFRVFPVQELRPALRILTERYPVLHGVDSGIPIHFRRCKPGKVAKLVSPAQDGGLTISFDRPCRALRTLGLLMAELYRLSRTLPEKELRKTFARSAKRLAEGIPGTETCPFETFGVLIDCSHNAVPKPESLHRTFERLALLGFNRVLLYCEDTFKLEDEPFFGFHRGAYSAEEIRELDDYADALGLELVPSIQTLTHLEQLFRWRAYLPIHDIAGNLLVDSKRAYDLIEKMLRFWRDNVRSRVIHVGMDESRWLGSGRYRLLHPNAPQPPVIDLVARHANRIAELCETLELKPVMWGEAWWRAASKKISGAGLLCCTSAPHTTSWKYRAVPVVCKFCSIIARGLELATMRGMPRSSSRASSSCRPGLQGTPWANRAWPICQTLSSIFCASTPGKNARRCALSFSPARPRPPA